MPKVALTLSLLPGRLAVCRLDPKAAIPDWATATPFFSISRNADELSIVCPEGQVPPEVRAAPGWRAIKLEGPFDFDLTGIVLSVAGPLAKADVTIFALSTYDTDYVLVRESQLEQALNALSGAGHLVRRGAGPPPTGA